MENKKEEKIEKVEKKNNGLLITCLVTVLMGACAIGGYSIGTAKTVEKYSNNIEKSVKESKTTKTTEETEPTKEEQVQVSDQTNCKEQKVVEKEKPRCYGTYYVNGNKDYGVYILKENGNWQVENSEQSGIFTINENTITMIEKKHTVGPREEDPYYDNPKSYLISDDCSRIRLTESGSHTSASLDKID